MVALTSWEAYLLTLVRLRRGLDVQLLAFLFGVSVSTASRVIATWIDFLAKELNFLIQWPTHEQLQNRSIAAFKYFNNTIAVIDCTEFFIQRASSTASQRKTWSHYPVKKIAWQFPGFYMAVCFKTWHSMASQAIARYFFDEIQIVAIAGLLLGAKFATLGTTWLPKL